VSSETQNAMLNQVMPARSGRPSNAMAGEVEERILEAAKRVFLDRGYDAASLDEIAAAARAGKATLYSRYAGKEALFTAVVEINIQRTLTIEQSAPREAPVEQRLIQAGTEILGRTLTAEVVAFMRVVVAAAPRFPDLAKRHHESAQRLCLTMMARVLLDQIEGRDTLPSDPAASARLYKTTQSFFNLVIAPLQFQALMGGDLAELRDEIPGHIEQAVALFIAAGHTKLSGP
jgi:AcrR family transcriptional regulator